MSSYRQKKFVYPFWLFSISEVYKDEANIETVVLFIDVEIVLLSIKL